MVNQWMSDLIQEITSLRKAFEQFIRHGKEEVDLGESLSLQGVHQLKDGKIYKVFFRLFIIFTLHFKNRMIYSSCK
jgi:hypothetical protein